MLVAACLSTVLSLSIFAIPILGLFFSLYISVVLVLLLKLFALVFISAIFMPILGLSAPLSISVSTMPMLELFVSPSTIPVPIPGSSAPMFAILISMLGLSTLFFCCTYAYI